MNLHEFFRSVMGFPSRKGPSFGEPPYRDDGAFGRDDNPYEGSMFGDPWDMFRHLDSVFRSFGLTEFPPFSHGTDIPAIEGPADRNEPGHLRDHMLKVPDYSAPFQRSPEMFPHFPPGTIQPEESPYLQTPPFCPGSPPQPEETPCRDMDLDEHVARSGLGSLFAPVPFEAPPQSAPPPGWWGGSSSSVHTFSSHNGKVQERTVVRDAQGNEEVTVHRSMGDQSITVRTITRPDGVTETQEQYINMDESEKASFEQMWQGSSAASPSDHKATDGAMFRRLFGFLPPSKSQ